ncbi:MAG: recombinase family protein [Oscillospiraceae bacterium]|nr:recombinase family protein [Oscillospiraceae bacterium]
MPEAEKKIITIQPKPELTEDKPTNRQLQVAAYCRVSTDDKEQLTSYENQKKHYTDKIMMNPEWTMAGIYADEGLSGTSAKKRPEFLRMVRNCRQKKIDLILTKSISRFARNTVDCLHYTRMLRSLGIGVYFEEQNINSLDAESELFITMYGAFAQSESENISANVRWGKRQAMREGRTGIKYRNFYGYKKGEDGKPEIVPEEAEVIREIFKRYIAGESYKMIADSLNTREIPLKDDMKMWTVGYIRGIILNEKYCGDVLLQKTFVSDCISKKVIKNTGQLPMYLIQNHHEAIIDRKTFEEAQTELTRRSARKSPSKKSAPTGRSRYSAKYALSERLVCGECGTLYRRCTWTKPGKKYIVWRCVSRLDFGTKYCHNSPSIDEGVLQKSIIAALNSAMSNKSELLSIISEAAEMELFSLNGTLLSKADIERKLKSIEAETISIIAKAAKEGKSVDFEQKMKTLLKETTKLKELRDKIDEQYTRNDTANNNLVKSVELMENYSPAITEWDETMIRRLVDTVKVISKDKIEVYLRGGEIITQDMLY